MDSPQNIRLMVSYKVSRPYLKKFQNIVTVGVAFSFQKHHKLPRDKKDVKLNYILTEKGIY